MTTTAALQLQRKRFPWVEFFFFFSPTEVSATCLDPKFYKGRGCECLGHFCIPTVEHVPHSRLLLNIDWVSKWIRAVIDYCVKSFSGITSFNPYDVPQGRFYYFINVQAQVIFKKSIPRGSIISVIIIHLERRSRWLNVLSSFTLFIVRFESQYFVRRYFVRRGYYPESLPPIFSALFVHSLLIRSKDTLKLFTIICYLIKNILSQT